MGPPLCHALSLLLLWTSILHCHSPGVATVARRLRYSYSWLRLILVVVSTVATPGEWQCKIRTGGVRRLAVANGPNIFQMLLVSSKLNWTGQRWACPVQCIGSDEMRWDAMSDVNGPLRYVWNSNQAVARPLGMRTMESLSLHATTFTESPSFVSSHDYRPSRRLKVVPAPPEK